MLLSKVEHCARASRPLAPGENDLLAKFHFNDIKRAYVESKEIGGTRDPIGAGIASVSVHCVGCGHVWRAGDNGVGRLRPTVQGMIVKCPECGASEEVSGSVFNAKT